MPPLSVVKTEIADSDFDRSMSTFSRRDAVHGKINRLQRPAETLAQARAALAAARRGLRNGSRRSGGRGRVGR